MGCMNKRLSWGFAYNITHRENSKNEYGFNNSKCIIRKATYQNAQADK